MVWKQEFATSQTAIQRFCKHITCIYLHEQSSNSPASLRNAKSVLWLLSFQTIQTMDNVQNLSNLNCNIPLSEPFRFS
jgi:hypothetical protein